MTNGAIIVAAGRSARMGGDDKLLVQVHGRPLLSWTLAPFTAAACVDEVVLVASAGNFMALVDLAHQEAKVAKVIRGGERRRDSVKAGLDALPGVEYVIVHDGARPLVTVGLIESALAGAR